MEADATQVRILNENRQHLEDLVTVDTQGEAIARAITVMQERIGERSLTLLDLANAAFLSQHHFCRIFRQRIGLSPMRYLARMRIHKAQQLLLTTTTTITDIGQQVGYTSLGCFEVRFRAVAGMTPGEYRASNGYKSLSESNK